MIITCPFCNKNFDVNTNLIPDKGRLLKCGSCEKTWFFNKNENKKSLNQNLKISKLIKYNKPRYHKKMTESVKEDRLNLSKNKGSELIKYKPKSNFTLSKVFSYLIVLIITFITIIIILDTFKSPLSLFFPNLELLLYNLFETLKDLILFTKDLN